MQFKREHRQLLALFTTLSAEVNNHGLSVRYKKSWWWNLTTKKSRQRVSLVGDGVYFPDVDWVEESPLRAIGALVHDFIHHIDKEADGIKYRFRYWCNRMWRRRYEMRGYVGNLLVGLLYATPSEDVFDKLATLMTQSVYCGMFRDHRDAVIEAKIGYAYAAGLAHEIMEKGGRPDKLEFLLGKDDAYHSRGLDYMVNFFVKCWREGV